MEYVNLEVTDELAEKQIGVFAEAGITDLGEYQMFMLIQHLKNETYREILVSYLELVDLKCKDDAPNIHRLGKSYIFSLINRGYINAIDGRFVVSDMMKNL